MTLPDVLNPLSKIAGLLFIVPTLLVMGLSLTVAQIIQPLRNARLVTLALLANFVLVPFLAYLILRVIPLEQSLRIGLVVLATAAGAPFLPKLVQDAKGDTAFSVALTVLLMVVTIMVMPIVLPLLIPGAQVRAWDIAWPLIVLMLIPLSLGMLIKFRAPGAATRWPPVLNRISTIALLVYVVIGLGLNISNIRSLIGTGGILALLLFIIGTMLIGFLLGGRDPRMRSVMGLGTAQRNVATAILVTAQNFSTGNTVSYVLVGAIILLIILLPTARLIGARQVAAAKSQGTGSAD